MIDIYVRNSGTAATQIIEIYIGISPTNLEKQTTTTPLPLLIPANSVVKITISYEWVSGTVYYFKIVTSTTQPLEFVYVAP